jgi:NitT/TauT family transport system permease protein
VSTSEQTTLDGLAPPPRRPWAALTGPGVVTLGLRLAFIAVLLSLWEFSAGRFFNEFWSSRPTLIFERLVELTRSGEIWRHVGATVSEAALGLLLGSVVGTPIGILLARYTKAAEVVDPVIMGLYGLPRVALAPLFILWFGIGLLSKVMMSFSMVLFIFILNVTEGIRTIDRDMADLMKTMRASRLYTIRKLVIPAILPWIVASFRIGIGLSLVGAVVGELIGANRGLGWYVAKSGGQLDTTGVFTSLLLLMALAMIANQLVVLVEGRLLRWRK